MGTHKVVLVVGVIGSGKSSLCLELGTALDALVLLEVAQEERNPFIHRFYLDMERWAFTLQVHQLAIRFEQHKLAQEWVRNKRGHAVCDGGFWLDTCFARLVHKAGFMSEAEYLTYHALFTSMTAETLYPTMVVRLDASPESALRRIAARAARHPERQSEATRVTVEYLSGLDQEITALCEKLSAVGVGVLHMCWDEDRDTPDQRRQAVEGLARRVREYVAPDPFFTSWQRRL